MTRLPQFHILPRLSQNLLHDLLVFAMDAKAAPPHPGANPIKLYLFGLTGWRDDRQAKF
jgi:hypothetical protein